MQRSMTYNKNINSNNNLLAEEAVIDEEDGLAEYNDCDCESLASSMRTNMGGQRQQVST